MEFFPVFSVVIVLAAICAYVNHRFVGLPTTIGVMLISLAMSLLLILAGWLGLPVRALAIPLLEQLHFRETLMNGMLAFLLFAGALQVNLDDLWGQKLVVGLLATVGVVVSTALVGGLTWLLGRWLGLSLSLVDSLLFGALISPTDPIAVLAIMRSVGAPKTLEVQLAGESLFNDGIGVIVFSVILGISTAASSGMAPSLGGIGLLVLREVIGSLVLGLVVGWMAFRMLRSVDNYQVEVLITLALAMGLYSLCSALHTSGPLAVVVAGILIGNSGRALAMSPKTVQQVDTFWELVDEILNVVLFLLIGFQVLIVNLTWKALVAGLLAIPLVLVSRFAGVAGTITTFQRWHPFPPHAIKILTWGGLRGGISVALALSLGPSVAGRHIILAVTYILVVFSVAVQGLTIGRLVRWAQVSVPMLDAAAETNEQPRA